MKAANDQPRILFLDIENLPMLAEVWGMWDQNISLNQVREWGRTTCVGMKWAGEKEVKLYSEWEHGHRQMLQIVHDAWSEADAVCGYNTIKFDERKLRGEFVKADMLPPAPCASIDVFRTVKSQFGFDSNKLDHVAQLLGLGSKVKHEGHALWSKVRDGDPAAQKRMARYCKQDVRLLEKVYYRLRPWIKNHPHLGFVAPVACGACGSIRTQKRGVRRTKAMMIERVHCQACGSWQDGARAKAA